MEARAWSRHDSGDVQDHEEDEREPDEDRAPLLGCQKPFFVS